MMSVDHHTEETISVLWLSISCNIYEVDGICGFVFPLCNVRRGKKMLGILHTMRQGDCTYLWQLIFCFEIKFCL